MLSNSDLFFKWVVPLFFIVLLLAPPFRKFIAKLLTITGAGSLVWLVRLFPAVGVFLILATIWTWVITGKTDGYRPSWYDKGSFVQVDSLNYCIVGMKGGTVRLLYYFAQPETQVKVNGKWQDPPATMECAQIKRPFRNKEMNEYHERYPWLHTEIKMQEGCTAMRLIYSEKGPGVIPVVPPGTMDHLDTMEIAIVNGVATGKLHRVPGDATKAKGR